MVVLKSADRPGECFPWPGVIRTAEVNVLSRNAVFILIKIKRSPISFHLTLNTFNYDRHERFKSRPKC